MSTKFRIGIVGYCQPTKFDYDEAWSLVQKGLNVASSRAPKNSDILVLGGFTDIPSIHCIGYQQARQRGWNCGGIACMKAMDYKLWNMSEEGDEANIVGDNWGDESQTFVNKIDILVRVGGGPQSFSEVQMAKEKGIEVLEYDLESE